ncbi:MAG: TraB/GumN family protein [Treponema sp.]|nr:TraB/GumN family protein [Treponema sp.]
MFWKISGTDKNGNPSVVYIQGTIHVGSKELYPLDKEVLDAFNNADRIAGNFQKTTCKTCSFMPCALFRKAF